MDELLGSFLENFADENSQVSPKITVSLFGYEPPSLESLISPFCIERVCKLFGVIDVRRN